MCAMRPVCLGHVRQRRDHRVPKHKVCEKVRAGTPCQAFQAIALANPGCALGPDPSSCGLPVDYDPGFCVHFATADCIQDSDCPAMGLCEADGFCAGTGNDIPCACAAGTGCANCPTPYCHTNEKCGLFVPQYAIDAGCLPVNFCTDQGNYCPAGTGAPKPCDDLTAPGTYTIGQLMDSPNNNTQTNGRTSSPS